jgi:hypothetical protein
MQDLRSELAKTLDQAEWSWLSPHLQRNSLIIVDANLNLLDVGVAIATDDTTLVQRWIAEQLIYKPSPEQISTWNAKQTKPFQALIVQPYVLVQEA